jgi:hypothetical protein
MQEVQLMSQHEASHVAQSAGPIVVSGDDGLDLQHRYRFSLRHNVNISLRSNSVSSYNFLVGFISGFFRRSLSAKNLYEKLLGYPWNRKTH